MLDKIIKYYTELGVKLPQNEIDIISKSVTHQCFNKKDFLFNEGDLDNSIYFVLKGCVRVFITDKNKNEYNRFFAFPDWWIGEYHQIMNNLPTKISAQALKKTEVLILNKKALDIIFEQCPVYTRAAYELYLKGYAELLEREEIKKTMTIEELYIDLMEDKPMILENIPLYHIASYLGIKPESLSRVKKKFK